MYSLRKRAKSIEANAPNVKSVKTKPVKKQIKTRKTTIVKKTKDTTTIDMSSKKDKKKVVKREPVKVKKTPTKKTPKQKISKEMKPTKTRSAAEITPIIPNNLDISTEMKGRILRAHKEKIFIISRERSEYQETYQVTGSTGNLYKVQIGPRISCSCRDFIYRRLHCKHVLAILMKAFHLPLNSPMFTDLTPRLDVLQAVFSTCIPDPSSFVPAELQYLVNKRINGEVDDPALNNITERRPLNTSDCPVCCEEFDANKINDITFCRTCGNNIHQICFNMWRSTRGIDTTCVFCRSPWEPKKTKKQDKNLNEEGYLNVGEVLGLPSKRDYSEYRRSRNDTNNSSN
ncbi:hypothetical protein BJ944DRAFT_274380 [Cunninghamella echinulata]|nr:hypothetical protein BJ944DRAFT_274380 [Cunninghamella echinulata]